LPDLTGKGSTLWDYLKVSIWLVPLAMSFAALVLAVVMLKIDVRYGYLPWSWAAVLRIDAASARQVVAVIFGAMMAFVAAARYLDFPVSYHREGDTSPRHGILLGVIFTASIGLFGLAIAAFLLVAT
jgi:hypothetical protein